MKTHLIRRDTDLHLAAYMYYDPSYLWVGYVEDTTTGYTVETEYFGGVGKSNAIDYTVRLLNRIAHERKEEMTSEELDSHNATVEARMTALFASL
jgi:hypothetical protein